MQQTLERGKYVWPSNRQGEQNKFQQPTLRSKYVAILAARPLIPWLDPNHRPWRSFSIIFWYTHLSVIFLLKFGSHRHDLCNQSWPNILQLGLPLDFRYWTLNDIFQHLILTAWEMDRLFRFLRWFFLLDRVLPNCKFGASCTRKNCPFPHTGRLAAPAAAVTTATKKRTLCLFFPLCHNVSCQFYHPLVSLGLGLPLENILSLLVLY